MATQQVALELIDDNPYQTRSSYPRSKIDELAHSIEEVGLLQVPEARPVDGRYQLAYGHLRLRAYKKLAKESPEKWGIMPLDVKEISDEVMALLSLEENLRRQDITPMDVARSVDRYLLSFPDSNETKLAKKLNMTQGNISNMRRVLTLPDLMREKIDAGIINFTMGRELLVLADLDGARDLMSQVVSELRFGEKTQGYPCTVEGIQKSIDHVCKYHLKPIKGSSSYGERPDFDIKVCQKCEKLLVTHPEKKATSSYCKDEKCWTEKQEQHRKAASEAAIKKMQEDLAMKAAADMERRDKEALDKARANKEPWLAEAEATRAAEAISQEIPRQPRVKKGKGPEFIHALHTDDTEKVEELLEAEADARDQQLDKEKEEEIAKAGELGAFLEDERTEKLEAVSETVTAIPEEALALAEEKAGTRAEVIDIKDFKGEHIMLKGRYDSGELSNLDDPDECTLRCTKGFHYAYDSSYRYDGYGKDESGSTLFVCTNPKCVAQKKGALTRKRNAAGLARKNAEKKAIKEAIDMTHSLERPQMYLILSAQMEGSHVTSYYSNKSVEKWLWDRVSSGTPAEKRDRKTLSNLVQKLTDEELAKVIVEMMFFYLSYAADGNVDISRYEIRTKKQLGWFGIDLEEGTKKKEEMNDAQSITDSEPEPTDQTD